MTLEHLRAKININNRAYQDASEARFTLFNLLKTCTAEQHNALLNVYHVLQGECARLGLEGERLSEQADELEG